MLGRGCGLGSGFGGKEVFGYMSAVEADEHRAGGMGGGGCDVGLVTTWV
jgi:hypothetical protein